MNEIISLKITGTHLNIVHLQYSSSSQLIPAPLRPHLRHILHVHPQHALQLVQRAQNFIPGVCPAVPGDPEKLDVLQLPDTTEARDERMDD